MVTSSSRPVPATPFLDIPPLENGDRLSREEFERRYAASPHIRKAELIEGVVYVASALRFEQHAEPHSRLMTWLGFYAAMTLGVSAGIEPTVLLDFDNEPQPDGVLLLSPERGGQARINSKGYIEGAPELAVEVAASSAAYDLGDKKNAFRRNGVQEYLVWQVFEDRIDWFCLQEGCYVQLSANDTGIIHSLVFPGLWLDAAAMRSGDMAGVIAVLQEGMASAEYREFVV